MGGGGNPNEMKSLNDKGVGTAGLNSATKGNGDNLLKPRIERFSMPATLVGAKSKFAHK